MEGQRYRHRQVLPQRKHQPQKQTVPSEKFTHFLRIHAQRHGRRSLRMDCFVFALPLRHPATRTQQLSIKKTENHSHLQKPDPHPRRRILLQRVLQLPNGNGDLQGKLQRHLRHRKDKNKVSLVTHPRSLSQRSGSRKYLLPARPGQKEKDHGQPERNRQAIRQEHLPEIRSKRLL